MKNLKFNRTEYLNTFFRVYLPPPQVLSNKPFPSRLFSCRLFQGLFTRSVVFLCFYFFFSLLLFNCKPKITTSTDTPTYKVTFDVNGGSAVASQTIEHSKTANRPKNPTKAGNLFVNWYSDKELKNVFDFATAITKDAVLYAKWSDKATVRFVYKQVTVSDNQQVSVGGKAADPGTIVKQEHNFVGYFSDEKWTTPFDFDTVISKNTTVYVKYDELMVKYDGNTVTGLADAYKITGAKGKTNIILTIPQTINGTQITDISRNNGVNSDNRFRLHAHSDAAKTPLHKIVKVVLPPGIARINHKAFMDSYITNINIPSTVDKIEDNALSFSKTTINGAEIIIKIKCDPTTPPTIANNTFIKAMWESKYEVSVPKANVDAYQKANNWNFYHRRLFLSIVAQK